MALVLWPDSESSYIPQEGGAGYEDEGYDGAYGIGWRGEGGDDWRGEGGHDSQGHAPSLTLYAMDEARGTRPKSRRGRGMRSRDAATAGGQEPQMGDDETYQQLDHEDARSGFANATHPLANTLHSQQTMQVGASSMRIDKGSGMSIDEARGIRPPSRRGRPPPRTSTPSLSAAHARHCLTADGGEEGADGEEQGRCSGELFSDCTTPHASTSPHASDDGGDALGVVPLGAGGGLSRTRHMERPSTAPAPSTRHRTNGLLGGTARFQGGADEDGTEHAPRPQQPSLVSQRLEVHNDDDGEETEDSADEDDSAMSHADASDDDDGMARRVSTLLGKARETLGIHTNGTHTNGWSNEESERSGWTAAASAGASLSLPPTGSLSLARTNVPPPEEHSGQKKGEERNGRREAWATAAGAMPPTAVAGIWQRQEKVLRVMNQKRNDILVCPRSFLTCLGRASSSPHLSPLSHLSPPSLHSIACTAISFDGILLEGVVHTFLVFPAPVLPREMLTMLCGVVCGAGARSKASGSRRRCSNLNTTKFSKCLSVDKEGGEN